MKVLCALKCGEELDTDKPGSLRYTHGWTSKRKGGGANAIRLPKYEDFWAHETCVDREASGISARQGTLG